MTLPPDRRVLNAEQKKAVEHGEGPLLIIAGAGTGKTTVITERIKHLIVSGLAKPSEILALTFTEKASREMEDRVDRVMPYGYTQMWISTFHSFCERVLRQEAVHIGLNPAFRLLSDADATMLVRKNLFSFDLDYFRPLGNPAKFIGGMLSHFDRLRDEDVTPTEYIAWAKTQNSSRSDRDKIQNEEEKLELKKYEELSRAYAKYQELKEKEGLMDFSDLIVNTLTLFRTRKNVLREYQKQFTFFLIDEFQDTNIAQNELVKLLVSGKHNITAVADDDQSIYKFRGAAVSNVLSFRDHFPDAEVIVLTKNYRSTQAILDTSYRLIQYNNPDRLEAKEGINKQLRSMRNIIGTPATCIHADRVENEAEEVVKQIQSSKLKVQSDGTKYTWKDYAILVRANNHAEPFVRACMRHGIPYQFLGPGQLFRQPEVKELIAYLQVLANFEDNVAVYRVLSMEYFDLSVRDLTAIIQYSKKNLVSFFEGCELFTGLRGQKSQELPFISDDTRKKLGVIITMIHRHLKLLPKETAGQILFYFLQDTGMFKNILDHVFPIDERKATNITKFFNKLKTYETEHDDASVSAVLDWILLSMELGESPLAGDMDWTSNDAVNILTIHGAKGLEFPVVFLVNLVSQRFPSMERREQIPIPDELIKEVLPVGDYHMEEERRLCYVGLTRARDRLYLTAADYYGEGKREKKLSPFIGEALGEEVSSIKHQVSGDATKQLTLLDWEKTEEQPVVTEHHHVVTYLSYSQIESFLLCPLHYKLRHILGIQSPPTPALTFGNCVHKTLKDFYELKRQGEKVNRKILLALLDKNWTTVGYTTKKYELEMRKRGKKYLTEYFDQVFDPAVTPVLLETPFSIQIRSGSRTLKIGGKIDRVDARADGKIEIIDYKTGRVPTQREMDTSVQLSIYAMAATDIASPPFGKKPEDIVLSLYYFDVQKKISTFRTREQLEAEKEKIIGIAKEIEVSDFRCSGNPLCAACEYKLFCGITEGSR